MKLKINKTTIFIGSFITLFIVLSLVTLIRNNVIGNEFLFYKTQSEYYEVNYFYSDADNNQIGIKVIPIQTLENVTYKFQIDLEDGEQIIKEYDNYDTLNPFATQTDLTNRIFLNITHYIYTYENVENVFMKITFTDSNGKEIVEKIKVLVQ